ncbi:MAG: response regulator [Halobacterium sp.]
MRPGDHHAGDSIRVLHVDDDESFGELVATCLERANDRIEVETTTDASEALATLDAARVDCVVSDYEMPETDGIELLEAVRDDYPDLPFVLFTGKGSEEVASDAVSAGVTDYLQKETGTDQYTVLANRVENAVDRFRSERALAERNRRLETLISNLPGIVYRCENDPDWPMEFVSGECERLTGYTADALESGDVVWGDDVIHPEDRDRMWVAVQDALDDREPFEVTYRIRTRDGTVKHVWERGRGIYGDDGDLVALEGFITDITDQREHERELERQNDRLEEFASIVSHDLRNPLNVADGRLELARQDCDSPHLDDVAAAHDRMWTLIDDLLTLARNGQLVTDTERVSLSTVAEDCWDSILTGDTTLTVASDRELFADADRLTQLLVNLFRNATEHGASTVTVGSLDSAAAGTDARADGPNAEGFFVADDGPGLPPDDRDTVFDAGYTTSEDGTGFGLAIVESVAEAHGWSVSITDSETGGARFEVTGVDPP